MINGKEKMLVNAVSDVVNSRLDVLRNEVIRLQAQVDGMRVEIAPPDVHVEPTPVTINQMAQEPPEVHVHSDDGPTVAAIGAVAAALDRFADVMQGHNEMMSQLVQVLAAQKPPRVSVNVPEQPAPAVTVQQPRGRRTATVKHSDGTESTITVE